METIIRRERPGGEHNFKLRRFHTNLIFKKREKKMGNRISIHGYGAGLFIISGSIVCVLVRVERIRTVGSAWRASLIDGK